MEILSDLVLHLAVHGVLCEAEGKILTYVLSNGSIWREEKRGEGGGEERRGGGREERGEREEEKRRGKEEER